MRAIIHGRKGGLNRGEAIRVSLDPGERYAVIEMPPDEFTAVRVTDREEDLLVGEYVNSYSFWDDTPMLHRFSVDWSGIRFGFCKLKLWAPELTPPAGGPSEKTVKRFYFDWELYKSSYEAANGVPCPRQDPNP